MPRQKSDFEPCYISLLFYPVSVFFLCSFSHASDLNINGFGSLAGGITADQKQYVLDYDNRLSFKQDSVFGLQTTKELDARGSVVAQILFRGEYNFSSELEWLYAFYKLTPTTTLKFGKFRIPFYEYSETLEVGYSYHWIRPPIEAYFLPLRSLSGGFELSQDWNWYDWLVDIKLAYGSADQKLPIPGPSLTHDDPNFFDVELNDLFLITSTITSGSLRFRLSYGETPDLTAKNEQTDLIKNALPKDIANDLLFENKFAKFSGAGLFYESETCLIGGEVVSLNWERNVLISDQVAFYITGALKENKSTLHLTYSEVKSNTEKYSYPSPLPAESTPWNQKSWTIGYRYELSIYSAIKAEYAFYLERPQLKVDSRPTNKSGETYDTRPSLLSFAFEFVF